MLTGFPESPDKIGRRSSTSRRCQESADLHSLRRQSATVPVATSGTSRCYHRRLPSCETSRSLVAPPSATAGGSS